MFINDNEFIYFRRSDWGPHADYHDIIKHTVDEGTVLVPADFGIISLEDETICSGIFHVPGNRTDNGIFLYENCVYLTTKWFNRTAIVKIDLESGLVTNVKVNETISCILMDISVNGKMIFVESSLIDPPRLIEENFDQTERIVLYEPVPNKNNFEFKQGSVSTTTNDQDSFYFHQITQPKSENLILFMHGGPHSSSGNEFNHKLFGYLKLGYDLIIPNYRGSLGFGFKYLRKLPGRIGHIDVADCIQSVRLAQKSKNYKNTFLIGGSHGGFLGTWLSSLEQFSACSIRNPVVNLNSMYAVTDIPDWIIYEAFGRKYTPGHVLSNEELEELRKKSPISNVKNVKTPTLMKIGLKDIRVPKYQGNYCILLYIRVTMEF